MSETTDSNNNNTITTIDENNNNNNSNNKVTKSFSRRTPSPLKSSKSMDVGDGSDACKYIFGEDEDEVFGSLTEEELLELAGIMFIFNSCSNISIFQMIIFSLIISSNFISSKDLD